MKIICDNLDTIKNLIKNPQALPSKSMVSIREIFLSFNPLLSKNVSTKIRSSFLRLLGLQILKNHIYNSIFNRNKFEVTYSYM